MVWKVAYNWVDIIEWLQMHFLQKNFNMSFALKYFLPVIILQKNVRPSFWELEMHFKLGLLGIAHFIKSKKSIKSLSKKGQMPTNLFLCQLYQKCILNWDFHILTMSASCQERQPISNAKPKTALYPGQGSLKNRQNWCTTDESTLQV